MTITELIAGFRRAIFKLDGWLVTHEYHLRFPRLYRLWDWTVVQPDMGFVRWWRWTQRKE